MTQYNSISVQEFCCIQQHEIRSFFEKSSFFSSQHSPSKKLGAESHVCKLSETKFKALNQLKKKLHLVPYQKQKKTFFQYEQKIIQEIKNSWAGNRYPASNVTGCDTHHYTTEDTVQRISSNFASSCHMKFSNYRTTQ